MSAHRKRADPGFAERGELLSLVRQRFRWGLVSATGLLPCGLARAQHLGSARGVAGAPKLPEGVSFGELTGFSATDTMHVPAVRSELPGGGLGGCLAKNVGQKNHSRPGRRQMRGRSPLGMGR